MSISYRQTLGVHKIRQQFGFSNPVAVAVNSRGRVYVLNRSDAWQDKNPRITGLDLDSGNPAEFGGFGTEPGQLVMPTALAIDHDDQIYVADEYTHAISVFSANGRFIRRWGQPGSEDSALDGPSGLALDAEGLLLVVDRGNARVKRFTLEGRFLSAFGSSGTAPGELNDPWGITSDPFGRIWVADWRNDRVVSFSAGGRYLGAIGGRDSPLLRRPSAVAVDRSGLVIVADRGADSVAAFNPQGELVARLIGDATLSLWGEEYVRQYAVVAERRNAAALFEQEKRFWRPSAVTSYERLILVADTCRHRIQVYETAAERAGASAAT